MGGWGFPAGPSSDSDYELQEAKSEIRRHHRDFGLIQNVLDRAETGGVSAADALIKIRNIVG